MEDMYETVRNNKYYKYYIIIGFIAQKRIDLSNCIFDKLEK